MKVTLFMPDIELTLDADTTLSASELCTRGVKGTVVSWGRTAPIEKTRLRPGLEVSVPGDSILFASTDFKENGE